MTADYSHIPYEFNPGLQHPAYLTRNGLLKAVASYAPELSGRLMDLGCGSKPYQSLFKVSEYIGVDYNSAGHPHHNEQIDVFYDGKTLPFANEHFDSVFSSEVFEHIFNIEEILQEVHRVMKPGGQLLATCPFVICEHESPNDFARYTSFAIKDIMQRNGFKVLQYQKAGNHVTAIMQLRIMYLHMHVLPVLKNIPVLRTMARLAVNISMNGWALLKSKLLPLRDDLYLNNIILCEKI